MKTDPLKKQIRKILSDHYFDEGAHEQVDIDGTAVCSECVKQLTDVMETEHKNRLKQIVEAATDDLGQISPDEVLDIIMEEL